MGRKDEMMNKLKNSGGRIGWVVLWLMGVPLPVLFILFLIRGCD
jgi:hypothetical protein